MAPLFPVSLASALRCGPVNALLLIIAPREPLCMMQLQIVLCLQLHGPSCCIWVALHFACGFASPWKLFIKMDEWFCGTSSRRFWHHHLATTAAVSDHLAKCSRAHLCASRHRLCVCQGSHIYWSSCTNSVLREGGKGCPSVKASVLPVHKYWLSLIVCTMCQVNNNLTPVGCPLRRSCWLPGKVLCGQRRLPPGNHSPVRQHCGGVGHGEHGVQLHAAKLGGQGCCTSAQRWCQCCLPLPHRLQSGHSLW